MATKAQDARSAGDGIRITKVERINVAFAMAQEQQHTWNELVCPLRGDYEATLDGGTRYRSQAGSVFVYPAGRRHSPRWVAPPPGASIDLLLVCWQGPLADPPLPVHTVLAAERLRQWCAWIQDCFSAGDQQGRLVADHLLRGLLIDLVRQSRRREDLVLVVDALIDQTHNRRLRIEDFAAAADLSRFHFSRRFKALTGESPMRYCRRRRLENARRSLLESDAPVAEIAAQHGFATAQQMATLMRRHFATTPREIRRPAR